VGTISLVGKVAQEKIQTLEEKLGIDLDLETLNPFGT
jgi:hypothetical protein